MLFLTSVRLFDSIDGDDFAHGVAVDSPRGSSRWSRFAA
jgi:hypothetical protein